jgi:hypothetical protein
MCASMNKIRPQIKSYGQYYGQYLSFFPQRQRRRRRRRRQGDDNDFFLRKSRDKNIPRTI